MNYRDIINKNKLKKMAKEPVFTCAHCGHNLQFLHIKLPGENWSYECNCVIFTCPVGAASSQGFLKGRGETKEAAQKDLNHKRCKNCKYCVNHTCLKRQEEMRVPRERGVVGVPTEENEKIKQKAQIVESFAVADDFCCGGFSEYK